MRISDWSSDVCSSDLVGRVVVRLRGVAVGHAHLGEADLAIAKRPPCVSAASGGANVDEIAVRQIAGIDDVLGLILVLQRSIDEYAAGGILRRTIVGLAGRRPRLLGGARVK